jgi:hypothetical protein
MSIGLKYLGFALLGGGSAALFILTGGLAAPLAAIFGLGFMALAGLISLGLGIAEHSHTPSNPVAGLASLGASTKGDLSGMVNLKIAGGLLLGGGAAALFILTGGLAAPLAAIIGAGVMALAGLISLGAAAKDHKGASQDAGLAFASRADSTASAASTLNNPTNKEAIAALEANTAQVFVTSDTKTDNYEIAVVYNNEGGEKKDMTLTHGSDPGSDPTALKRIIQAKAKGESDENEDFNDESAFASLGAEAITVEVLEAKDLSAQAGGPSASL